MAKPVRLNRKRVDALVDPMLCWLQEHYTNGPAGQVVVFEALNALAQVTAIVLVGTGDAEGLGEWFMRAVADNVADVEQQGPQFYGVKLQ